MAGADDNLRRNSWSKEISEADKCLNEALATVTSTLDLLKALEASKEDSPIATSLPYNNNLKQNTNAKMARGQDMARIAGYSPLIARSRSDVAARRRQLGPQHRASLDSGMNAMPVRTLNKNEVSIRSVSDLPSACATTWVMTEALQSLSLASTLIGDQESFPGGMSLSPKSNQALDPLTQEYEAGVETTMAKSRQDKTDKDMQDRAEIQQGTAFDLRQDSTLASIDRSHKSLTQAHYIVKKKVMRSLTQSRRLHNRSQQRLRSTIGPDQNFKIPTDF